MWRELYKARSALVKARHSLPTPSSVAIEVARSVMRTVPTSRDDAKDQLQREFGKSRSDNLAVDTSPVHCNLWQYQTAPRDELGNVVTEWENYPAETQGAFTFGLVFRFGNLTVCGHSCSRASVTSQGIIHN